MYNNYWNNVQLLVSEISRTFLVLILKMTKNALGHNHNHITLRSHKRFSESFIFTRMKITTYWSKYLFGNIWFKKLSFQVFNYLKINFFFSWKERKIKSDNPTTQLISCFEVLKLPKIGCVFHNGALYMELLKHQQFKILYTIWENLKIITLEGKLTYTKTTEDGFIVKMNEIYQSRF